MLYLYIQSVKTVCDPLRHPLFSNFTAHRSRSFDLPCIVCQQKLSHNDIIHMYLTSIYIYTRIFYLFYLVDYLLTHSLTFLLAYMHVWYIQAIIDISNYMLHIISTHTNVYIFIYRNIQNTPIHTSPALTMKQASRKQLKSRCAGFASECRWIWQWFFWSSLEAHFTKKGNELKNHEKSWTILWLEPLFEGAHDRICGHRDITESMGFPGWCVLRTKGTLGRPPREAERLEEIHDTKYNTL
jgi:hypothetical protein